MYRNRRNSFIESITNKLQSPKNYPFVDGNKRTDFTIGTLFLELNEYRLLAPEPAAAIAFEKLAAGKLTEAKLAAWFKEHCSKG